MEENPVSSRETRSFHDQIHTYAGIARRGWKLIAIAVVISMTVASIYMSKLRTTYRATSRVLLIETPVRILPSGSPVDTFRNSSDEEDSLPTHMLLMRSPVIVERAIKISGLGNLSPSAVIGGLAVKRPDEYARIVEITMRSPSKQEATKMVEAVMLSYNEFLSEKYQKNTNSIIELISRARDELSKDLSSLEAQYLETRRKNPAYSADEKGRSFLVRRLDQWDQSMNQVLARSMQLKSQLELGRKLADEGVDHETITGALNQLGGMGGTSAATPLASGGGRVAGGQSIDGLRGEIAEVESQRLGVELLLTHLRHELAESASKAGVSDQEIAEAFYADPEVAKVQAERRQKQAKLQDAQRLSRSSDDPSIVGMRRRVKELDDEVQRLWQQQKPILAARMSNDTNAEISASVRKAEVELITLKAKRSALGEQLGRLVSGQLQRLRRDRERLRTLQGDDHPQVRQIDQQIAQLDGGAGSSPDRSPGGERNEALLGSIARSLEAIEAMRADLQAKFEGDLDASKKSEIDQLVESNMRSNLERQRALFFSVVDQLKQVQLRDSGSVSAQVINPTEVFDEKPKFLSIIAMALVAGCGLGLLGAYVADLLEARIGTVAEMRELFMRPVIGLIPELPPKQLAAIGRVALLSHEFPRSILAESYKSIRTNLEVLRRNRRAQVLLVCSPQSGEGKTTTASNLAITLAHTGRRVLLIDADLRKPSMHIFYELPPGRGLTDALQGSGSSEQFARPTGVDNVALLSSGSEVPNPAELLASPRLGEFLDQAREAYDIIIIDSSPLLAVTDASVIAAVADGILLVVRVAMTRRPEVERAMELINTMGLPLLGVVINGIARNQFRYGYANYGYGVQNGAITAPGRNGAIPAAEHLPTSHGLNGRIEFHPRSHEAS